MCTIHIAVIVLQGGGAKLPACHEMLNTSFCIYIVLNTNMLCSQIYVPATYIFVIVISYAHSITHYRYYVYSLNVVECVILSFDGLHHALTALMDLNLRVSARVTLHSMETSLSLSLPFVYEENSHMFCSW